MLNSNRFSTIAPLNLHEEIHEIIYASYSLQVNFPKIDLLNALVHKVYAKIIKKNIYVSAIYGRVD